LNEIRSSTEHVVGSTTDIRAVMAEDDGQPVTTSRTSLSYPRKRAGNISGRLWVRVRDRRVTLRREAVAPDEDVGPIDRPFRREETDAP